MMPDDQYDADSPLSRPAPAHSLDVAWAAAEAAADAYRAGSLRGARRPASPLIVRRYTATDYKAEAEGIWAIERTPAAALGALTGKLAALRETWRRGER